MGKKILSGFCIFPMLFLVGPPDGGTSALSRVPFPFCGLIVH
uniref:Uncharacterized protein n=1 Tax=Anguilla anguilla TaxID=7936 RepID=A0A0E9PGI9_ANGAN